MDTTLVQILASLFGLEQENAQLRAEIERRDKLAADNTRTRLDATKAELEGTAPPTPGG